MQTSWKARAFAAALAASILLVSAFAASASALPARFWGVDPQATPTLEQAERLHRGGVDSMRVPLDWGSLQPTPNGPIEFGGVDGFVERAARSGIELLPFITGAPKWAVPAGLVPGGGGAKAPAHLPAKGAAATAWAHLLEELVKRYGQFGSFWAEHPSVPERPIRTWQVWNEPNFKYFVARPNPAEYGKLVKVSYAAIKNVDSGAQVILGGLFARPKGSRVPGTTKHKSPNWFASDFLAAMYKGTPGVKASFNGIALHPYTSRYQELPEEVEEFRRVLTLNHDSAKGLWITEMGWSSQRPPANPLANVFAKGPAGQVTQLNGAFHLLVTSQAKWRLQRIYWFSVDDSVGTCNFCDGTGLFATGFKPKKSWYAYVRFAGGTP